MPEAGESPGEAERQGEGALVGRVWMTCSSRAGVAILQAVCTDLAMVVAAALLTDCGLAFWYFW